jgi:hypothetical protein
MPFFSDVPLFQLLADEHQRAGTVPLTSFRGSNTFVAYGGGAVWIFLLFRQLSESMEALLVLHALLHGLAAWALYHVFRDRLGRGDRWLLVWFVLSAPILFFLSRVVWDNGFFVPLSALLLLLVHRLDRGDPAAFWPWISLGLLAAGLLNIHLMALPILPGVALAACTLLWRSNASAWRKGALPLLALAFFALGVAPYFRELIALYGAESAGEKTAAHHLWGNGRNLWWLLLRTLAYAGTFGTKSLLENAHADFLAHAGWLGPVFRTDILGWFPKLAAIGVAFWLPVRAWRGRRLSGLEWLYVYSFFGSILFLNVINVSTELHYFQPAWWIPFVGAGLALGALRARWQKALRYLLVLAALVNSAFTLAFVWYVAENGGIRNGRYGPSFESLRASTGALCREAGPGSVALDVSGVNTGIHSHRYFLGRLPECAGVTALFEPVEAKAAPRWRVQYEDGPSSARLRWTKVSP